MKRRQLGATMIEFALVVLLLFMFLLGIIDFSRLLYTWNAAAEATRLGARYAVVCDDTYQRLKVLAKMKEVLPAIRDISIEWKPAGCTASDCESVMVSITSIDYAWYSPLPGVTAAPLIEVPRSPTYMTRERMRQDPNSNAICS